MGKLNKTFIPVMVAISIMIASLLIVISYPYNVHAESSTFSVSYGGLEFQLPDYLTYYSGSIADNLLYQYIGDDIGDCQIFFNTEGSMTSKEFKKRKEEFEKIYASDPTVSGPVDVTVAGFKGFTFIIKSNKNNHVINEFTYINNTRDKLVVVMNASVYYPVGDTFINDVRQIPKNTILDSPLVKYTVKVKKGKTKNFEKSLIKKLGINGSYVVQIYGDYRTSLKYCSKKGTFKVRGKKRGTDTEIMHISGYVDGEMKGFDVIVTVKVS